MNFEQNYYHSFLRIDLTIRGNISIQIDGLKREQIIWKNINENTTLTENGNKFTFYWLKSEFPYIYQDKVNLYLDGAMTRPSSRTFAFSSIFIVDNKFYDECRILNVTQDIHLDNLYHNRIYLESTNLVLTHLRDENFEAEPSTEAFSSEYEELIISNIDLEFSTRASRFREEMSLIFLAFLIEPALEIRAIAKDLLEKYEKRKNNSQSKDENKDTNKTSVQQKPINSQYKGKRNDTQLPNTTQKRNK